MISPYPDISDAELIMAGTLFLLFLAVLFSAAVLLPSVFGRRGGMAAGGFVMVVSLLAAGGLAWYVPHLAWTAVIPFALGWFGLRTWKCRTDLKVLRPRFELGALLTFLLFLSIALAGLGSQWRQALIEREAVAVVESLPGSNSISFTLGRVSHVVLHAPVSPQDLERLVPALRQCTSLEYLQIEGSQLPGSVTQPLAELSRLRSLSLQHVLVSDDDLLPLGKLNRLEVLDLQADRITPAGLAHLAPLKRLKLLHLYNADQIPPVTMQQFRRQFPHLD